MISRYIASFKCCFPDPENDAAAVAALVPDIQKRAARRMSLLGRQIFHVMSDIDLDLDTSLIYGTTFTEAKALETFLDSIPYASPTAFQTSIHPGGIEQALIMRRQEVAALFPLAGDRTLFLQMIQTALTCSTPRAVILGGEEKGTWLQEFDLAYPRLFAFSMEIRKEPGNCAGSITWDNENPLESPVLPCLEDAVRALHSRETLIFGSPDHGRFRIDWK